METSAFQSAKLALVAFAGLSKDALHIYAGLAILFAMVFVLRRPVRSWVPLLGVLLAAVAAELLDLRDDLATFGRWRWSASLHDIGNTVFWPAILFGLARYTNVFQPSVVAAKHRGSRANEL